MGAVPKHLMQHAFTTGEMSPATLARQDLNKYASGLQILENFQVAPQGGIYNDAGTVFVDATKFSASSARLFPFVFSDQQAYVLELGNLYARFYTADGQIQVSGTPVEIITPYLSAELNAIQYTQSGDYLYLVHPNHPPAAITRTNNVTWSYVVLTFTDGPYQDENQDPTHTITASGVTGSVTLTANFPAWNAGNVGALVRIEEAVTSVYDQWATGIAYPFGYYVTNAGNVYQCQSNPPAAAWVTATAYAHLAVVSNVGNIYMANAAISSGTAAPTQSTGTVNNWVFIATITSIPQEPEAMWQNGVEYDVGYYVYWGQNVYITGAKGTSTNNPPTSMNPSLADNHAGVDNVAYVYVGQRSGTRGPVQVSGTQSDGVLTWLYLDSGFGYAQITAYTDAEHVTATVLSNQLPQSSTGGTLRFRLGAWDAFNGYPSVISFYESRLCFAGSANYPQTIWMSNTDDYYNFAPTDTGTNVLDTNSLNITLASGALNKIVWMVPATRLLVGTVGSEWQIWPSNTSSGFSPSNVQAKEMSLFGSALVRPQRMYQSVLYTSRSQKRIYEATYNYIYDLYVSKDLNLISEHILREGDGVVDTAVQLDPWSTLWILRDDGQIVGLTYINDEQIEAWHRHVYSGAVESIACIPNSATNSDQLWMIVNRTINGATARYVEYMQEPFRPANAQDKSSMWYVECGLSLTTSTPVTTVSGLGYLQGQTIAIVVDGAVQPPQVVPSSGSITLQIAAQTQVVVGLPYNSTMTIMPLDFEGQRGTIQGQTNKVRRVYVRLLNSMGMTIFSGSVATPDPTNEAIITQSFRATTNNMNQSPPFFTGDYPVDIQSTADNPQGIYTIQQTQPYPLNLLGIIAEATAYER